MTVSNIVCTSKWLLSMKRKNLQIVEAIYIDQDEMDTVVKAEWSNEESGRNVWHGIWKDYVFLKIERK